VETVYWFELHRTIIGGTITAVLKVAVLPFNAGEGAKPQLGRQLSSFVADQLRSNAEADIQTVSFLTQIEQEGVQRTAFVNISDTLLDAEQLTDLFGQSGVDVAMDGMIKGSEKGYELTVRFSNQSSEATTDVHDFATSEVFEVLHKLVKKLADQAQIGLPEFLAGEKMEFGTDNASAFLKFLEGYDALSYIQQSNGAVAQEFNPEGALNTLLESISEDSEFEGSYQVLVGLCRACTSFRIGSFELIESSLLKAGELVPTDFGAFFALGELYQAGNNLAKAVDMFEKASQINPEDGAIFNRLANAQMAMGMPVNAERNFKKAIELEGPDKPSMDFLAGVLAETNRQHEIPPLWKGLVDSDPQNASAHAKYAISLIQNSKAEEGVKAFEHALVTLDDNTLVKRYYAPYLVQTEDLDRAMDFYEDCVDVAPTDVPLLLEYAQTLQSADRAFEVPAVLQSILKTEPDLNTKAQTQAWLIELEQPKRIESINSAQEKLNNDDAEGAIRELKPLRNWLADYWKLWAMLSSAYNKIGSHVEAEEAAKRLLDLFPGCEPAYGELREALNGQGKNEDAWQFMQFAFSNNSQSFGLFINLGIAARRAGHTEEAKQIASQIREVAKDNPEMMKEVSAVIAELES
jgi:tetratricopeptide (TPR) repeat protein